jgi:glycosyltransferase involved in cell wall biosynthesis
MKDTAFAKVTVITRTKNRPILLKRALHSVLGQSFKDFLWVVVNDGGQKDPVQQIVDEATEAGIRVVFVSNIESRGMEAASNIGIDSASSELIVIHDDDDSWDSSFLDTSVQFLDSNQRYMGVVTLTTQVIEEIERDEISIKEFRSFNPGLKSVYLADMGAQNLFPPISFVYRRTALKDLGGYNESLPVLGDWEFNLRFLEKFDIGVVYQPLAFYHHRPKATSDNGNSIYDGIEKHIEYDALVRNLFLRKDFVSGKFGLGYIVSAGRERILTRNTSGYFGKISRLLNLRPSLLSLLKRTHKKGKNRKN